jgi:hypothetical protein
MLQPDRVAYCFTLIHELPDVEFKGPGKGRDNPLFGKVVRGAMAMANRRGGGIIIIGVSETDAGLSFDGLTPEQFATWKYESLASGLNSYTSIPIEFERLEYEHDGKKFLVLDTHEFDSVPVMCVKEYLDNSNPNLPVDQRKVILRPGAFYVRTLNKPESKEMLTSEEARTLFMLAGDKGIQTFVTHTKLASINIALRPQDKELFDCQLDGWTSPLLEEIRSRGYWDIRIRPVTFQKERMSLSELYPLLVRAHLDYRGWEFPYVTRQMPNRGNDWIGFEIQEQWALQAWRFFQSGQFVAHVGVLEDWTDKREDSKVLEGTYSKLLATREVIYRLTEIFGLASRLAMTDVYHDEQTVVVDLRLCNIQNRQLYGREIHLLPSLHGYITSADDIPCPTQLLAKEDVIARPHELARDAARYIFERFGYNPSDQLLASIQQSELSIHS